MPFAGRARQESQAGWYGRIRIGGKKTEENHGRKLPADMPGKSNRQKWTDPSVNGKNRMIAGETSEESR